MDKNNFGGYDDDFSQEPSNKPQKKFFNKTNTITIIVIVAAAIIVCIALFNIIGIKSEDLANKSDYAQLQSYTKKSEDANTFEGSLTNIDFNALQKLNPEICGWIRVLGTDIDYPIVKRDNSYYIDNNALNKANRGGAIFIDENNKNDFSDKNTIVYGHNMNDGSMFAQLHKFEDGNFFNENNIVEIYTPTGLWKYKVFGAYETSDISDTYTTSFSQGEYAKYLDKVKGDSLHSSDVVLDENSNIITLSTCIKNQNEKRFVVQAVLENKAEN